MTGLRLSFMGTPAFAVPTLRALIEAGHDVAAVYTQPPRAAGRGLDARPSPVQEVAAAAEIEVRSPKSLKGSEALAAFRALAADAAVVVAYGLILPPPILAAPRLGCINLHASLLPRWRGAAPIQRAIIAGDGETGVSVMLMEAGLDTGPVLLSKRVPITPETTAGGLHDVLAHLGAPLVLQALDGLASARLTATPQVEAGATYAKKIDKSETRLDWRRPAGELQRLVHGLSPVPGAWFQDDGVRIKVLEAVAAPGASAPPGTILDDALTVACGDGVLSLRSLQRAGKAALPAPVFLRGYPLAPGTRLG